MADVASAGGKPTSRRRCHKCTYEYRCMHLVKHENVNGSYSIVKDAKPYNREGNVMISKRSWIKPFFVDKKDSQRIRRQGSIGACRTRAVQGSGQDLIYKLIVTEK